MKILLCTSNKIGARLIRLVTWSKYSHAAVIDGDKVIEAVRPYVREVPLKDVLASHPESIIIDFDCKEEKEILQAIRSQIGKPYDITALFGLFFHRNWQEEDSWFCSELVAWALSKGGYPLFREEALHRVTPNHLWMLNIPHK